MESSVDIFEYSRCNCHVKKSLDLIEQSILEYGIDKICVSFNGGKDCTVVLHMIHSVVRKINFNNNIQKLIAYYAQLPDHFREESDFVDEIVSTYNLDLRKYSLLSLKDSLFKLRIDEPRIRAIFVGTRSSDMGQDEKIQAIAPTDEGWPEFIRINPILDWSYNQVWDFILDLNVPYCDLYNQGYSSIGTKQDTAKNPNLLCYDKEGQPYYLPAWKLTKVSEERIHRKC